MSHYTSRIMILLQSLILQIHCSTVLGMMQRVQDVDRFRLFLVLKLLFVSLIISRIILSRPVVKFSKLCRSGTKPDSRGARVRFELQILKVKGPLNTENNFIETDPLTCTLVISIELLQYKWPCMHHLRSSKGVGFSQ